MVVTMTHFGYVKRLPKSTYRAQHRGGKGVSGMATREEDFAERLIIVNTHDEIMFFTNRGRVYNLKCYQIPEAGRTARGMAIVNLLQICGRRKGDRHDPRAARTGGALSGHDDQKRHDQAHALQRVRQPAQGGPDRHHAARG